MNAEPPADAPAPVPPPAPAPPAPVPPDQASDAAAARAEAAATRRRWINLGEFIAVAGLLIAGGSLWLNWSDRRSELAEKQAEKAVESRYEIKTTVDPNGDVRVAGDDRHSLGDVTVAFPGALGVGTRTSPAQTIPLDWYKAALLSVTDGGPDAQTGTLPVLLSVQYFDGDTPRVARGLYDIVWRTEGRFALGRTLQVVSVKRHAGSATQAQVDRLWVASRSAR